MLRQVRCRYERHTTAVTATTAQSGSTVSAHPGPEVSLAEGANEIAVTVTAEDGETTQTDTVTVGRVEAPALPVASAEGRVVGPSPSLSISQMRSRRPGTGDGEWTVRREDSGRVHQEVREDGAVQARSTPREMAFNQIQKG